MAIPQVTTDFPTEAKTGRVLPPCVVRHLDNDGGATYFATAVLLNDAGNIVEGVLKKRTVSGSAENGENKGDSVVKYTIDDLVIPVPGTYSIILNLLKQPFGQGADVWKTEILGPITVTDEAPVGASNRVQE